MLLPNWAVGWKLLLCAAGSLSMGMTESTAAERDYPVRPVPPTGVRVTGGFWAPRLETNRRVTIWYDFGKCEETGRIDNFAIAGGLKKGRFQGIFFNDSDVMKVIEGAAYSLATDPDPKLEAYVDGVIAKIAAAQEDDGYLYTARTINDPDYNYPGKEGRWSHTQSGHELYNVGHLYEAAVAYYQATGKRTLLDVAIKNADLVARVFGPGKKIDVPGHEEIEIGLVKLYRTTGDEKYLKLAQFFVAMRGRADKRQTHGAYCQDHVPVVEQHEAVGHAVRAGYLYAGVADVAALTGEAAYSKAIDRIWHNVVSAKLHLTGGIGARQEGEAFGENYELPNESAYLETCAAIANALWNQRMFLLHGDAKYIDVLERVVYNGFLAGVSLSGDRFFYPNPLAFDGRSAFNQGTAGRAPWFACSCCPVNVVRFLPSIPGYVYAHRGKSVYVNLFVEGTGKIDLDGQSICLTQRTRYPWDGTIRIEVNVSAPTAFALHVRIPGWAEGRPVPSDLYRYLHAESARVELSLNGEPVQTKREQGFAILTRTWQAGDMVELTLPMPTWRVVAHDKVAEDVGRVAIERGPIVYCLEAIDNDGAVTGLFLPDEAALSVKYCGDLLGGVAMVRGDGQRVVRREDGSLCTMPAQIAAVPYYAWAHRGAGEMAVWLARTAAVAKARPAPTIVSPSRATTSDVR